MLEIVTYPHPALRYESRLVTRIDESLRSTMREMFELMYEAKGIGLAANQVALPFRFFILNLTGDAAEKEQERVFLNPEIVRCEGTVEDEEGCLSFPGLYGKVKRHKRIRLRAMDLSGRIFEQDASDLLSRAYQHESDHLAGRLFVDHFDDETRNASAPLVEEIVAGYRRLQEEGKYPPDAEIVRQLEALCRANRLTPPPDA